MHKLRGREGALDGAAAVIAATPTTAPYGRVKVAIIIVLAIIAFPITIAVLIAAWGRR